MDAQAHSRLHIALPLAMTMALGPLAIDTYLPAFPDIARSLGTSIQQVSLSISFYVFAFAFGQLFAGPLADHWGRKPVMLTGLGILSVASLALSHTQTLEQLLLLRALQAFGGGWAAVCVPALVRDRLAGNAAARFFSLIGLIMIIAPAVAPGIGSIILINFGWPAVFVFLGVYGIFMIGLLRSTVFSHSYSEPLPIAGMNPVQRYLSVLSIRPALRFMALGAFAFSVMLIFITHSAFIYQTHFGAGPGEFSLLFAANIVVMVAMNLTNRQLLKRYAAVRILRAALTLQGLGVIALLLVSTLQPSLYLFLPAMMMTVGAMGAISPNIIACYMEYFPRHGGTASALMGAGQFSIAGLLSAASALLPEQLLSVVAAQAVCAAVCLLLIWTRRDQAYHSSSQRDSV